MRLFELLSLGSVLPALAVYGWGLAGRQSGRRSTSRLILLGVVPLLLLALHLAVEGYRWQFVPVYVAGGFVAISLAYIVRHGHVLSSGVK